MKKLLLAACFLLSGCLTESSGEKIGQITRINKEGMIPFCKTQEVEILRGGMNDGSGTMGSAFHFTVNDTKLLEQVRTAMEKQQEVKIYYHKEWWLLLESCQSRSDRVFLDKIEIVGNRK